MPALGLTSGRREPEPSRDPRWISRFKVSARAPIVLDTHDHKDVKTLRYKNVNGGSLRGRVDSE